MGTLSFTCGLGYKNMSRDELDKLVLENDGIVPTGVGRFDCWAFEINYGGPQTAFDWKVTIVGTEGCGNRGWQVLLPTNKRTFRIFREGRIRTLIRKHGISRAFAEKLFNACKGVQYSHEKDVLETVIMWGHDDAWLTYPEVGHGVNRWKQRTPKIPNRSVPRLDSVAKIIRRLKVA